MNRYLIAMTAIPLLISASAGQAAPKTFGCDTAAGRFSEFKDAVRAEGLILRGTITPNEFRKDKRWAPSGWVRIGDDDTNVRIRLLADDGAAKEAYIFVSTVNDGKTLEGPVGSVKIGQSVSFNLVVMENSVRVTVDGKSTEVALTLPKDVELSMACSTGDFVFENVEW